MSADANQAWQHVWDWLLLDEPDEPEPSGQDQNQTTAKQGRLANIDGGLWREYL
jgi:hypothetical protein